MLPTFQWDFRKEGENQRKHGVSFAEAQLAFLDPRRVIARDASYGAFHLSKRYDSNHRRRILAPR